MELIKSKFTKELYGAEDGLKVPAEVGLRKALGASPAPKLNLFLLLREY